MIILDLPSVRCSWKHCSGFVSKHYLYWVLLNACQDFTSIFTFCLFFLYICIKTFLQNHWIQIVKCQYSMMTWLDCWRFQSISLACLRFTILGTKSGPLHFSLCLCCWEPCLLAIGFPSQYWGTLSTFFRSTHSFNYFIGISLEFWYIRYSLFDFFVL